MTTNRRTYVLIMEPAGDEWWRVHVESWIGDGGASSCVKSRIHQDDAMTVLDDLTWLTEEWIAGRIGDFEDDAVHFSPYSSPAPLACIHGDYHRPGECPEAGAP